MGKLAVGLLLNPSESVIRYFIFISETIPLKATAEALNEYEVTAHPLAIAATVMCLTSSRKLFYYLHKVKTTTVKDQRRRVVVVTTAVIWSGR
jgi:hypothetical protein